MPAPPLAVQWCSPYSHPQISASAAQHLTSCSLALGSSGESGSHTQKENEREFIASFVQDSDCGTSAQTLHNYHQAAFPLCKEMRCLTLIIRAIRYAPAALG